MSTETYEAFKKNLPNLLRDIVTRKEHDPAGSIRTRGSCGDLYVERNVRGILLSQVAAHVLLSKLTGIDVA